jgi:hypothetical protein
VPLQLQEKQRRPARQSLAIFVAMEKLISFLDIGLHRSIGPNMADLVQVEGVQIQTNANPAAYPFMPANWRCRTENTRIRNE